MTYGRVDANQCAIVKAMRKQGAFVQMLSEVGHGVPDLLVGYAGKTALVEVKDGSKPPSAQALTGDQLAWHGAWRGGTLAIVNDVDGALRVLATMAGADAKEQA